MERRPAKRDGRGSLSAMLRVNAAFISEAFAAACRQTAAFLPQMEEHGALPGRRYAVFEIRAIRVIRGKNVER